MTTDTDTTDGEAPVPITMGNPDGELHEDFRAFAETLYGVCEVIDAVNENTEAFEEAGWQQKHVDRFQDAFHVGERVLEHESFDDFKQEGFTALPPDLREDVEEKMAPLAPVFGADLSMDASVNPILETLVDQSFHYGRGS